MSLCVIIIKTLNNKVMKQILLILFTLLPVSMMGQVKAGDVIKGNVLDEMGKPMQMVMISELNENKRIVAHAASDVNGDFSLKIQARR